VCQGSRGGAHVLFGREGGREAIAQADNSGTLVAQKRTQTDLGIEDDDEIEPHTSFIIYTSTEGNA
jgi:hypothetical protein